MRLIGCRTVLTVLLNTILAGPAPVLSQLFNLNLEHFNTAKGLSQSLVYSMAQDKQGFLWFATDEGLNRFDGFEFKNYLHNPQDSTTLRSNSVHALLVDRQGLLWIGTNQGLSRYDPATEKFTNLPIDYYDINKLNGNSINGIAEDTKGRIWIAYLGSGVDVITPGVEEITHYTVHRAEDDPYRIPDDYITSMEFLPGDEVILGTRSGLVFIGSDGTIVDNVDTRFPWNKKIDPSVKVIKSSNQGTRLWFGTENSGVFMADLKTNQVTNFSTATGQLLFNNNVPALFVDSRQNVWVGGEAIYRYDPNNGNLIAFNEFGIPYYVENKNPILSIFEDRDRNLWFGTFRIGALKHNPQSSRLIHYHSHNGPYSIRNDQVLSFAEDDEKNIWVGTDGGGLYQLLPDQYTFKRAPGADRFSSQVIKCLYRDGKGNLWMGTWDGGMMQYHPKKNTLEIFSPRKGNFSSYHVWDIVPDQDNNLWIATLRDGLYHFSTTTKKFTPYRNNPNDSASLVNNDVLAIAMDSENKLWVGTANGLSVLNANDKKFVNRNNALLSNPLCFYEHQKKQMWIGTNGNGIVITDLNQNILKVIAGKDGLSSPTICSMIPDDNNHIWVSSYNGIVAIDADTYKIITIPPMDGLQGKEFIARAGMKTSDKKILFGGVNGFNMFHPDSLLLREIIPNIVFTSLQVKGHEIIPGIEYNGRTILQKSITQTGHINLNYDDNSVTVYFSPLAFNWQNNMRFSYRLKNFDPDWQFSGSDKRFVHYTNLDPGTYTLQVRASFDGISWPEQSTALAIIITPPWWGTLAFKLCTAVLGIGLLYGLYKTRIRLLKNRQFKLERVVTERTHDLQESNKEIRILLEEVAEQKKDIEEKNHKLIDANNAVVQQHDELKEQSLELIKVRNRLMEINANLETLVEKRTQKLSNTLRELETFLYRASHDLRGPISSMLGILNISDLEKDNEVLKKTYSELFRKSVVQLDRALQKLLLKHTLERKKLAPETFLKPDLEIFVWEISGEIPSLRTADLQIQIQDAIHLSIDRLILKTIIIHLLENAFYFSSLAANKTVIFSAQIINNKHILTFTDHGPGIKPSLREKIFDMFFRGHEFSTGNGLGLYMVKSALEKINGQIDLDTFEEQYTTFRVILS